VPPGKGGSVFRKATRFLLLAIAALPGLAQPQIIATVAAGQYRAALTAAFDDGSIRNVSILSVIAPAGTPVGSDVTDRDRPLGTSACATKLLPQFTATGLNSSLTVGYPATISATVVDDCGAPIDQRFRDGFLQ
jgi:hypothetical protein